jgi:hypothetical protein
LIDFLSLSPFRHTGWELILSNIEVPAWQPFFVLTLRISRISEIEIKHFFSGNV